MEYNEVHSLQETVDLMLSEDWKDRLVAEYLQAKIRKEKLYRAIQKANREFTSKPPSTHKLVGYELLEKEYRALKEYLLSLELRLKDLNIDVGTNKADN